MTTSAEQEQRERGGMDSEIPESLAGPNAPKKSDAPRTWDLMRGNHPADEMHPYWVHIVTASGTTLLAASLLSLMGLAGWGWIIAFFVLVFFGGVLGSALTHRAGEMLNKLGHASGALWGAGIGGLAMLMQYAGWVGNSLAASARPVWLAWIAMAVIGSIVHRWIWGRAVEISDPQHPRGIAFRAKRNGGIWETAFARAGFGTVTVEKVNERWSGMDVIVRTDPNKATSVKQVQAAADRIADYAHKALRESGEEQGLGLGDAEAHGPYGGQRDVILFRVRTRDPLVEDITPVIPRPEEFAVYDNDTGILLGYWETGEDMVVPAAGPHKFGVGTTGSGKSTWLIALQVGYARRPHWTMWAAGTSKLMDMIQPIVDAAEAVNGRPLFEMWGGGDSGSQGELYAAERMIVAAYLLYLDRAERAGRGKLSGRQGRDFVGADDCPWVALFLDEFDNLVKRSGDKPIRLPNGDKKTVWGMLVDLGSKARSYGIELVYATQRTTNSWAGGNGINRSMNDILTMCNTRFVFATSSGSSISDILKSQEAAQKAKRLEEMNFACMATIRGQKKAEGSGYQYGKTALWTDDDLVEITRMANELGTLTTIGPEDRRALGEFYAEGAQPQKNPRGTGASSGGTASSGDGASKADPAKWGDPDRSAERARLADELLRKSGGPSSRVTRRNDVDAAENTGRPAAGGPADAPNENDFAETLAQIESLDTLSQAEVDALREQYQDRYPDEPEELLGALLDAWAELDPKPDRLTPKEMVTRFGLDWLDDRRKDRFDRAVSEGKSEDEAADLVSGAASTKLGEILRAEPIEVEPTRTGRGWTYKLADLRAAYDRIMDLDD